MLFEGINMEAIDIKYRMDRNYIKYMKDHSIIEKSALNGAEFILPYLPFLKIFLWFSSESAGFSLHFPAKVPRISVGLYFSPWFYNIFETIDLI
jgi:hypothetical protein